MKNVKYFGAISVFLSTVFLLAGCQEGTGEENTNFSNNQTDGLEDSFLRLGQGTKGVWLSDVEPYDPEWMSDWTDVWKNHLDVLEVLVKSDWHYRNWDFTDLSLSPEERASWQSKRLVDRLTEWIDALHKDGLLAAISIGYQGSQIGVSGTEMMNLSPNHFATDFYAWKLDPETGARVKGEGFDWCNPAGIEYARQAYLDMSLLIGPKVDFLFLNELTMTQLVTGGWWTGPFYSDFALENFRAYVADPEATFPFDLSVLSEGVFLQEPELFNTVPTSSDWDQWYDWVAENYRRRIATTSEGFAAGQDGNPNWRGVIWFQNYNWVGREWGIDVEKISSIPEVTYIICENLETPTISNPTWAQWKSSTDAWGKKLGAFVSLSKVVPGSAGHVNEGITPEKVGKTLQYAMEGEPVPMITMYWAGTFHPDPDLSDGTYRTDLISVWDDWTKNQ